jgi:membrane associated rhomboid family serine protease
MASGPDLFVVCKNCGSEVSPYITECPYCGGRLRKRAPKLEKGGTPKPPKAARRRPQAPSLGKLRPGEIPGIRADLSLRPYATMALVLVPALVTVGVRAGIPPLVDLFLPSLLGSDVWRLLLANFVYLSTGYEVVALVAIGVFGWLLERRHGFWAPLLVYGLATLAGAAALGVSDTTPLAMGGNAGALGLLAAWAVPSLLEHRRDPEDSELDRYGLIAFAVVLLALPIATPYASAAAGLAGAVLGLLLGLVLSRMRRRN